jgi:hypothetical protein
LILSELILEVSSYQRFLVVAHLFLCNSLL